MTEWAENASGLVVPARLARRPTAVDLFCGAGGFSLGLLQAGFDVIAGCDASPEATVTYLVNLGGDRVDLRFVTAEDEDRFEAFCEKKLVKKANGVFRMNAVTGSNRHAEWGPPGWTGVPVFWFGDVSQLTGERLLEPTGVAPGDLDLVVGGPPCQGFSSAGKQDPADPRNLLIFEFARLVCEMRPKTMAMEEVPTVVNFRMADGRSVMDELCRILERGDFGEFKALHQALTGLKLRAARRAERAMGPDSEPEPAVQQELFG